MTITPANIIYTIKKSTPTMKRKQPAATTTSKLSKIVPPTTSSGATSVGDPFLNAAATDGNDIDDFLTTLKTNQEPKKKRRNRGDYSPA